MFFGRFTLISYPRWYFELLTRWNSDSSSNFASRNDVAGFFCELWFLSILAAPEPSSGGKAPQKIENWRLTTASTIPETSCCAGLGNVNHLHGKFIPATCGPKYEQKHAFWVTEGKRQRRWLLSQEKSGQIVSKPKFWRRIRISTSWQLEMWSTVRYERKTTKKGDFGP